MVLLATFAPALLLFAVLLCGRRPGERVLLTLRRRRSEPRVFGRPVAAPRPRLGFVRPLVGRVLESGIVVRPPPLTAVVPQH